jgi:hypothetical protein
MIFRSTGVNAWAREKGHLGTSSPFLSKQLVCNNEGCALGWMNDGPSALNNLPFVSIFAAGATVLAAVVMLPQAEYNRGAGSYRGCLACPDIPAS